MNNSIDYKETILSRYCSEFLRANEKEANIRKTSEQIMLDLRPMADLSTNQISKYMIKMGYEMGMEDSTPVWLMVQIKEDERR